VAQIVGAAGERGGLPRAALALAQVVIGTADWTQAPRPPPMIDTAPNCRVASRRHSGVSLVAILPHKVRPHGKRALVNTLSNRP
jgi:hypothetical protein